MAAISGYAGSVDAGGAVGNLHEWQVTIQRDNFDISSFQQAGGWQDNLNGLAEWSGQATGNFDLADSGQAALQTALLSGNTISLTLSTGNATGTATTGEGGQTFSGTANITSMDAKVPVNNKVDITFKFKGKGALAVA